MKFEVPDIKTIVADVVVVGGGGAGLAAAVAAAEKGIKNVILLETRRAPGGNAVFPTGIFAAESRLQKRLGIDASRDELFKKAMSYAHWKLNARLVRSLIDKSADTIRWLEDKGVNFVQVPFHYPNQIPPTFHISQGPGKTGATVVKALLKSSESLGVRVLCQTRAKKLISEKGKIAGVLAEGKDGEFSINAKSVIIATGGFAGDNEMLKRYLPTYDENEVSHKGIRHKGDGIRLATEAGAAIEGMAMLEMEGPVFPESALASCIARRPMTIWVNKQGERFADEAISYIFPEAVNTIYRQPGKIIYALFDEAIKNAILEEGLIQLEEFELGHSVESEAVNRDLQLQIDKGAIKTSSSLDDIAGWIGAGTAALRSTIDDYNAFCQHGHDDDFAKDPRHLLQINTPPYYAIPCRLGLLATHGGIKTNQHLEVVDGDGNLISGLYAAGVDVGGTDSDTYNSHLTGHSFGFTINSGRIAGERAAEFALKK